VQETRHNPTAARYLYGTDLGIVEFRSIPTVTDVIYTLIVHEPDCDGEGCALGVHDCDAGIGDHIAWSWLRSGDDGVWVELREWAIARELDDIDSDIPHERSAAGREFLARARRYAAEHDEN
jgi:hypothetical protein